MKKIAYIIGHRSECEQREINLKSTIKWLLMVKEKCKKFIKLVIIIVEQDDSPKLHLDNDDIIHLFIYNSGEYNRGWAFNVGYFIVRAGYYFFADNDIILKSDDIISVFKKCFKYDAVNPYNHIYDSTCDYMSDPSFDSCKEDIFSCQFPERYHTCFAGGIVGLSYESMYIVAGYDERFRGRGWEDYAFTAKIMLFLRRLHTFEYNAVHLWHPEQSNVSNENNYELNKAYEQYTVHDYIKQIEKSLNTFGSPIKYSYIDDTSPKPHSIKFDYSWLSKLAHRRYHDILKNIKMIFRGLDKDKQKKYVYLELSGQLRWLFDDNSSNVHTS